MKKITSLLILALGVTTLFAQENPMFLYTQGLSAEIPVTRSSDNNRYFVGCFNGDALLYDYQTGNVFQNVYDVTANFYEFKAVSNDGVVVGSYGYSLDDMVPMTFTNGTATALSDKGIPSYYYGCANSISADGRTIGGFIDFGGNLYHPIVWIDNVASILEYPNIDQYGETPSGAIVDHVYAVGTVIVGRYYITNYDEIGISWILNPATNSYEANLFSP